MPLPKSAEPPRRILIQDVRPQVEILVDTAGPVDRVVLPRYEEGAEVAEHKSDQRRARWPLRWYHPFSKPSLKR